MNALPEHPLISVIVPSFNQGAFIRKTIESALQQDYRPIEVVVMDGASTDNTVDILKSFGDIPELRWVSEPDQGVVDAVNKGLRLARGEIAAIQSSDDFYLPGAFSTVAERPTRRRWGFRDWRRAICRTSWSPRFDSASAWISSTITL